MLIFGDGTLFAENKYGRSCLGGDRVVVVSKSRKRAVVLIFKVEDGRGGFPIDR